MIFPLRTESSVHFTSFDVSGRPSWKRTPCRRWNTYVSALGMSQLSARPGCTLKCSSRVSRSSKRRPSMRSEYASIPTRGSRFVGLLSMIMTTSSRAGFCEHDRFVPAIKAQIISRTTRCELRIGDLAQDRRTLRPGRSRDVGGIAVPGLEGEQRKGDGFLGLGRQAELIGKTQANPEFGKLGRHHAEQCRILRAASGDYQLLIRARFLQDEPLQRVRDRARSEGRSGGHNVLLPRTAAAAQEVADKLPSKFLAACCFRRFTQEKGGGQQLLEHRLQHGPSRGGVAIGIVRLAIKLVHDGVDHHVAVPRVEWHPPSGNSCKNHGGKD